MSEIVPAINTTTFAEVQRRAEMASGRVRLVHIDVADGSFTPNTTWQIPSDLNDLKVPVEIEIHFMVQDPEKKIDPWLRAPVKRIIFHAEATHEGMSIIERCHQAGKQAGVSIRPDTPWETLKPYLSIADMAHILAVSPGPSGQVFSQDMIEKIRRVRECDAHIPIEVDGGVVPGVARACQSAGATHLVVGSYVYNEHVDFTQALSIISDDLAA